MNQPFFQDQTSEKMDSIKQNNASMLVIVRLRPLTLKEMAVCPIECIRAIDSKMIALVQSEDNDKKRNREAQFAFDFVYAKDASTKSIYDESLTSFLGGVLDGYNSTILAYGATGCGKTYTMIGEGNNQGLCALFLIDLLGRAQQLKITHHVTLKLSYIEIYNEVIKDLLTSEDKVLEIRQDPKQGVYAQGSTEVQVNSLVQLATLLKVGAANRSKEATGSNEASSRSHALLLVKAQTSEKAQGIKQETNIGKLSLVDLAGSERANGPKGSRQVEGGKINKSLLTLGNCIKILAERNRTHIPYRQSKLTRLLKESLGGNSRTAMLACLSPFSGTREESYNTLLYASRARNIGSSLTRNVVSSQAHLSNYVALIGNLKRENEQLKRQLKSNKNYSLPQLKMSSSPIQLQADRLAGKIDSHFSKELTLIRAIHEVHLKLDKAAFKLLKLQIHLKRGKQKKMLKSSKFQRQEQNTRNMIQQLGEHQQKLQTRLHDCVLERSALVEEIQNGQWGPNQISSLFTHYRQRKIESELEEVKLRQARIISEKEEKDDLLQMFGQQIKARDKIIEEQRVIIQKNNIINRITYSRLNQSQLLPELTQQFEMSLKPSLPKDLASDYNEFEAKKEKSTKMIKNLQTIIKRSANQLQSINSSELSLDKKLLKERKNSLPKSSKKKAKYRSNENNKSKHSQLDHIYLQR